MPPSERSRSGVSLGRVALSFFFFLPLPSCGCGGAPPSVPSPSGAAAEGLGLALKREAAAAEGWPGLVGAAASEGQSRDQWPGRPHLKQPVGAAAAMGWVWGIGN